VIDELLTEKARKLPQKGVGQKHRGVSGEPNQWTGCFIDAPDAWNGGD